MTIEDGVRNLQDSKKAYANNLQALAELLDEEGNRVEGLYRGTFEALSEELEKSAPRAAEEGGDPATSPFPPSRSALDILRGLAGK